MDERGLNTGSEEIPKKRKKATEAQTKVWMEIYVLN